jgi:hypothetical protein
VLLGPWGDHTAPCREVSPVAQIVTGLVLESRWAARRTMYQDVMYIGVGTVVLILVIVVIVLLLRRGGV